RYLAVELGRQGITVNAVSAGAVETDVWHMIPDGAQALEAIRARTPGGRLVTPEAVADVVFFLARPAAQGIQGQGLTGAGRPAAPWWRPARARFWRRRGRGCSSARAASATISASSARSPMRAERRTGG